MNTLSQFETTHFSTRTRDLHASPIREILAVVDRPGMISFAGGLPAVDSFPQFNLDAMPQPMLQYGPSEGEWQLRQRVAEDLNTRGLRCTAEQVLILSGSQQGIDLVAKLFIDPGTSVAVESPTYLAALQVFRFFGARFLAYDADALDVPAWQREKPALAYAIPTFQNPSGRCLDAHQRDALAAACDAANVPLFEDDPYRDLVYDACERTPVCGRLQRAPWVYQGSFSKSLAPGLRLGYLAASPELLPFLTRLKQAADLHSNRVSQWLVLQQLNDPACEQRLRELACVTVSAAMPSKPHCDGISGTSPVGRCRPADCFSGSRCNRHIDTRQLLPKAIDAGSRLHAGRAILPGASGELRPTAP